jgi:hypothetical protein
MLVWGESICQYDDRKRTLPLCFLRMEAECSYEAPAGTFTRYLKLQRVLGSIGAINLPRILARI